MRQSFALALILVFSAVPASSQTSTGYWQYVRMDPDVHCSSGQPIKSKPCNAPRTAILTGGEFNLNVTVAYPAAMSPVAPGAFGVAFTWNQPPSVLIPGTYLDWRVSATVTQNSGQMNPGAGEWIGLVTSFCSYPRPDSNSLNNPNCGLPSEQSLGGVYFFGAWAGDPKTNATVGATLISSNLDNPHPCGQGGRCAPNGVPGGATPGQLMTLQVDVTDGWFFEDFMWNYVYQWVPTPVGQCTGTCSISPGSQSFPAAGGSGAVALTATAQWNIVTFDSWINVTSSTSGSGNASVTYTVAPNSGSPRLGMILIGGKSFTVIQSGGGGSNGCNYSISPQSIQAVPGGGPGSVNVSADSGCTWSATTTTSWLHITSGANGTGSGSVQYSVDPNTSTSAPSRTGTITIAGQTFTVTQASGAAPSITLLNAGTYAAVPDSCSNPGPTKTAFAPTDSMVALLFRVTGQKTGDVASVDYISPSGQVYAPYSGPWDPVGTTTPGNTWCGTDKSFKIAGTPIASMTGTWTAKLTWNGVPFSILTFTIGNAAPTCAYSINPTSTQVPAGGGSGSFQVTAPSGCTWSANPDSTWITISGASSGSGNGTVNYSVTANSGSARNGAIGVGGQTFAISQSAAVSTTPGSGYWQYVRTDSYFAPYRSDGPYPDTWTGVEGAYNVRITEPSVSPLPSLGAFFTWSRPPSILIPGKPIYWPISATVNDNGPGRFLGIVWTAAWYPYQPVSDLTKPNLWASRGFGSVGVQWSDPVGTTYTDNDALRKPADMSLVPTGTTTWMDSNNLAAIVVDFRASSDYYWSYIYRWIPNAGVGTCVGVCSLSSPGQNFGANGGSGSVGLTASSSWDVVVSDGWVKVTSATSGNGNATVTYTVDPNTGPPRSTVIIIGGLPYTIFQGATNSGTGPSCTYSISPTSMQAAATGASGSVAVAAAAGCSWSTTPGPSWITFTGATSGSGNGTVSLSVAANTDAARTGTVTIAGQTFTVNQAAGTSSTGSTCTGTCTIGSPGTTISAKGGPVTISVTSDGQWSANSPVSWVQITSGKNGNGNGSVTVSVSPNTGPPRDGTITIAGIPYTIHQDGTPTGTTAGCSYLIQSATTQSVPASGTLSGFIQVVTAPNCAWTSTKTADWITITAGASVTGNGAVSYTVPANTDPLPRSGAIVIAGQNIAVNQDAGSAAPPPGTPVISPNGVVNTASYAPCGPPNGSVAPGSFFSIYGSSLTPDTPYKADSYPLPTSLGGVSVQIVQGTNRYDAYLVFAGVNQINAIMPSAVGTGPAQVIVTYNGKSSQPAAVTVAKTSLGLFFQQDNSVNMAIAQNVQSASVYIRNLASTPARPGQTVIFWGTGMGAISGGDNVAPAGGDMSDVPVTMTIGGINAPRLYAGRAPQVAGIDNLYFTIPAGVPYGCQVPVVVTAGGVSANTIMLAVTADGSPCR